MWDVIESFAEITIESVDSVLKIGDNTLQLQL